MMNDPVTVTVLGCRGSLPVSGPSYSRYGGATCCILIRGGGHAVLLDAGSGLFHLPSCLPNVSELSLFLTHAHLDHLIGLPMCPFASDPEFRLHLYGADRNGMDLKAQISALFSPPFWPITVDQLPAQLFFHPLSAKTECRGFTVEAVEGCHPGGISVLRLTLAGRSIVLMTDCTITAENRGILLEFCRDCDLLLCDGQYTEEEWHTRSHFGHNSQLHAAHFGLACGAKQIRLIHHDPAHTDDQLDLARAAIRAMGPHCDLAYEGEELLL